jgi:hypothetical protein
MEPSRRNQWQPVANGTALKTAHSSETLAVGCDQLPESFHGKGALPKKGRGSPLWLRKKRQALRTRGPTGLDAATLTGVPCLVNLAPPAAHHSASTPTVALASRAYAW